MRKLLYLLGAQDLELDKHNEDIVRATVLCEAAILSSSFCVNMSYKVAPYKYIWNYIQGSLLKLNFHRWNILILHDFFIEYFYSWLKCLPIFFCRPNFPVSTSYCKIQYNYYGNAFNISVNCLELVKLSETFFVW